MSSIHWILGYILLTAFIIFVSDLARRYFNYKWQVAQKSVLLELTPPSISHKSPLATEQLFSVLYHLGSMSNWKDRLLDRSASFSFEVVSTRHEGIRYLVRLSQDSQAVFEQQVAAYLPGAKYKVVEDYINQVHEGYLSLNEFTQGRHFAYPLASHETLAQHDPIAYIAGSMTRLEADELVAFQLVVSPAQLREVRLISNKLILGKDPNLYAKHRKLLFRLIRLMFLAPLILIHELANITAPRVVGAQYPKRSSRPDYLQTPASQTLFASIQDKLNQPIFKAGIRTMVISRDKQTVNRTASSLTAALGSFTVPGYQGLYAKRLFPRRFRLPYRMQSFRYRLLAPFTKWSCVLSVSEVASLYHFPYGQTSSTENLVRSSSRTLPASAELKHSADTSEFDIVLGLNKHNGSNTPIGLTAAERERHVFVVGATGNGKTTMLQGAAIQDIKNGKGLAVIDPHGDMAETLLEYIPEDRLDDVIYFNPEDIDYPIGLNFLELPKDLSPSKLALEKDFVTEAIVSLFRKTFSEDDSGGHRIESILRNAIRTAFTVEGATLFTLYDLLTDDIFRKSVVSKLEDKRLIQFWNNEFGRAGHMQRVKMMGGVTNKLGRFDSSIVARRVIEQAESTIDFEDIINSGKILICNFAKGSIGEDTASLFGTAMLTKLQLAALRRVRIKQTERRPFYLYVDEFQNFATESFLQMLSEARKYKLFLTMAEQSPAQQAEKRLTQIILDNVGTVVCFRVRAASEKLLLPIFQPYLETGEIASLPAYSYYVKINGMKSYEPLSGETVVNEDSGVNNIAVEVVLQSRKNYANAYINPAKDFMIDKTEVEDPNGESDNESLAA
jgi:hypothetical protein